jgi:hypothetical protein
MPHNESLLVLFLVFSYHRGMPQRKKTYQILSITLLCLALIDLYLSVILLCSFWHGIFWKFSSDNALTGLWLAGLALLPFVFLIIGAFSSAQNWEGSNPKRFHQVALSLVALGFIFPACFYAGEQIALQNQSVYSVSGWEEAEGYARYLMIPDFEKKVDLTGGDVHTMEAYLTDGYIDRSAESLAKETNGHAYYYYLGYRENFPEGEFVYYELKFSTQGIFSSRAIITREDSIR